MGEQGTDSKRCKEVLQAGGVVAFPTDTVYGFGADIYRSEAVERIYALKSREQNKPFLLNIGDSEQLTPYVQAVNTLHERLMKDFWPGPLTILFPVSERIPAYVTRGYTTVGFRIPDHPLALAMLQGYPAPVVSTSVNYAGTPPLLTSVEVYRDFGEQIDYVLGIDEVCTGRPSTIIEVAGDAIRIIRQGACDQALLRDYGRYLS